MKFLNAPKTEKMGSGFIETDGMTLEYKNDNGEGYPKEANIYSHFIYLAGYDLMEEITSGKRPLSDIKQEIGFKYGKESAEKIFNLLEGMYNANLEDNSKIEFKNAIELEKEFLKCVSMDINKLNNKNDIEKYANIYRAYKINLLPKIYDDKFKEHTEEYFQEIKDLDNKMTEKIIKTRAFGLNNEKTAHQLLYTSNEPVAQDSNDYYQAFVPPNLAKTQYTIDNNGNLVLYYLNRSVVDNKNVTVVMSIEKDALVGIKYDKPSGLKSFVNSDEIER